jgi:hypothetical protein
VPGVPEFLVTFVFLTVFCQKSRQHGPSPPLVPKPRNYVGGSSSSQTHHRKPPTCFSDLHGLSSPHPILHPRLPQSPDSYHYSTPHVRLDIFFSLLSSSYLDVVSVDLGESGTPALGKYLKSLKTRTSPTTVARSFEGHWRQGGQQ